MNTGLTLVLLLLLDKYLPESFVNILLHQLVIGFNKELTAYSRTEEEKHNFQAELELWKRIRLRGSWTFRDRMRS